MHAATLLVDGDKRGYVIGGVPKSSTQKDHLAWSATVLLKKNETAESIFFEDQALLGAERFSAAADQHHLPNLLP